MRLGKQLVPWRFNAALLNRIYVPFLPSSPPPSSYIAVNPAIGLKKRGAKGRVELKVLMEEGKEEEAGDIKGIEHWKKYKASAISSLDCCFYLFRY